MGWVAGGRIPIGLFHRGSSRSFGWNRGGWRGGGIPTAVAKSIAAKETMGKHTVGCIGRFLTGNHSSRDLWCCRISSISVGLSHGEGCWFHTTAKTGAWTLKNGLLRTTRTLVGDFNQSFKGSLTMWSVGRGGSRENLPQTP